MAAGLDPGRFWDLTPRLLMHELDGAALRLRRERELVWWGAMIPHLKRRPTFEEFTGPRAAPRRQGRVELQAMCDALAAAWGARAI